MALDDGGAEIDPATTPDGVGLMARIDAELAAAEAVRAHRLGLARQLSSVIPDAAARIEGRVLQRSGSHALEEDLRGGIAEALRDRGELVMTEAKLAVPGWPVNLGGFDLAVVTENTLVVGETKWADGNLYESMWDIFKLASAAQIPRVSASVAIYGAPKKHWSRPDTCARLFEDRQVLPHQLMLGRANEWAKNLAGSTATPSAVPLQVELTLLTAASVTVLGKEWEIRAVSVDGYPRDITLKDGWPAAELSTKAQPYAW